MKCYLVLMRMPKEYYAIQQTLFQYDWGKIDMDLITKKFSAEDSRQIANKQTQIEESKKNKPSQEEALAAVSKKKYNNKGRPNTDAKPAVKLSNRRCLSF